MLPPLAIFSPFRWSGDDSEWFLIHP